MAVVGVSSNDVTTHPDDGPEQMKSEATAQGYPFPYLFDESQAVAQAYRAACTPDFFLFDNQFRLVYRGQMDDSRPKQNSVSTGADLRAALDALLSGKPIPEPQKPSIGCNIKWKAGCEPEYFNPAGIG
ncbi:MAG: thioredoxin family protein [Pirellulales bacterium]